MRILHVEDDSHVKVFLKSIFSILDHEVDQIQTLEEMNGIIDKGDLGRYQVIVCDYNLIGCNGVQITELVRKHSKIPIVANSSLSVNNGAMLLEGADYVVTKGLYMNSPVERWKQEFEEIGY